MVITFSCCIPLSYSFNRYSWYAYTATSTFAVTQTHWLIASRIAGILVAASSTFSANNFPYSCHYTSWRCCSSYVHLCSVCLIAQCVYLFLFALYKIFANSKNRLGDWAVWASIRFSKHYVSLYVN